MKLGVLSAMTEEQGTVTALLQQQQVRVIGGRSYLSGRLGENEIVSVFSRWGKVAAASTTAILLHEFDVDAVLFVGVAGAVHPQLEIGDIVLAQSCVQYDIDASALPGLRRYEVPLTGKIQFETDPEFSDRILAAVERYRQSPEAAALPLRLPNVVRGVVATGDAFVTDLSNLDDLCATVRGVQCVEMEGGAVAQVCHEYRVPFAVLRVISDKSDHSAVVDFPTFVACHAAPVCGGILREFLQTA